MKGIFLRIPEDLDKRFSVRCDQEGYKKSGLILKWIRDFVETGEERDFVQEAKDFGIDIGHLKANLRKTPTQRLENQARAQAFAQKLRKAKARTP